MPSKSTFDNFYPNKSLKKYFENQNCISPEPQIINNILAYSKALSVLKSQYCAGKSMKHFRLILN